MVAKTFYIKNVAVDGFGSLSETDPGSSLSGTSWTMSTTPAGNFSPMLYGSDNVASFSTTDYLTPTYPMPQNGDSWRTENAITGTFASGNWTFTFAMRMNSAFHGNAQRGRVKFRLWRSQDVNGISASEIMNTAQTCSIITAPSLVSDVFSTLTVSLPTLVFVSEYLFVQCEWEITTQGLNGCDLHFMASSSNIVTSDYSTTVATIPSVRSPAAFWIGGTGAQEGFVHFGERSLFAFWLGGSGQLTQIVSISTEIHFNPFFAHTGRMMGK